jgi:CheY-like chemotaxis protein
MPDCGLTCERCGLNEMLPLRESDFGILLAEGKVKMPCPQCSEPTVWKLVVPPRPEPGEKSKSGRRPRRVLLIDDDVDTLRILQLMLLPDKYRVVTAESANRAIELLQTEDFDAIVSDIRMPGFDGRSLFRFLALFLPDYVSKVVFLTGDHSDKTVQFLRESNCPYFFKPIHIPELKEKIQEIT